MKIKCCNCKTKKSRKWFTYVNGILCIVCARGYLPVKELTPTEYLKQNGWKGLIEVMENRKLDQDNTVKSANGKEIEN